MKLHQLVKAYGGWTDLWVDLHVYGGGLLAAGGIALWSPVGAGMAVFGGLLVYLGLGRH